MAPSFSQPPVYKSNLLRRAKRMKEGQPGEIKRSPSAVSKFHFLTLEGGLLVLSLLFVAISCVTGIAIATLYVVSHGDMKSFSRRDSQKRWA